MDYHNARLRGIADAISERSPFSAEVAREAADEIDRLEARIAALEEENARMRKALENMLKRYVDLAGSGDCGFWDPEDEDEVKASRAALEASR